MAVHSKHRHSLGKTNSKLKLAPGKRSNDYAVSGQSPWEPYQYYNYWTLRDISAMGMVVFGILILLGFLLSMAANVTNIVQAFQESVTWGLLVFFVPFAIFVFVVKFWQKKWVSRVFLMGIGGAVLSVGSVVGLIASMPPELRNEVFAGDDGYYDESWDSEFQSYETQSSNRTAVFEPFAEGVRFATIAAGQAQTAQTAADWNAVANNWDYAIGLMRSVPAGDPNFAVAQQKVEEYGRNLSYADQNAQ